VSYRDEDITFRDEVTVEGITIKVSEIANLMCAVADANSWKRGRRKFMVTNRNFFGMPFELRKKDEVTKLVAPTWICETIKTTGRIVGSPKFNLPTIGHVTIPGERPMGRWQRTQKTEIKTVIRPYEIILPTFEIGCVEAFHRDWTLIRLFGSEWAHYDRS
jgi:hypothetical protein